LVNDQLSIATLSLSTADATLLLLGKTMQVKGRLGNLEFTNDSDSYSPRPEFRQIMSIEGENFAEFCYQTFETRTVASTTQSSIQLKAASVKLQVLERPLHDVVLFMNRLAKLKGLYDAATQAAVQSAPDIGSMRFDISVKSPIIIFPSDPLCSRDALILRLGEISLRNQCENLVNTISAGLHGVQFVSELYRDDECSSLKIIDEINVDAKVLQTGGIDRTVDYNNPDTQASWTSRLRVDSKLMFYRSICTFQTYASI
jgi:vacuolar protein sorting-associated protein 13A/C